MRAVVLVGLMGSGKSTVGTLVARRTGRQFVDVDVTITARTGKTVRELWQEGGEAAYRKLESDVVLAALRAEVPTVLAAPGGVVLDPEVRDALGDAFVVWLRADPVVLAARVQAGDHRPLLDDHPGEALTRMESTRAHWYREAADVVLDVGTIDAETTAETIVTLLGDGT